MFLCISIFILSTAFPALSAYAKTNANNISKIDSELFKELQKMDNDDTINISIWLNDIDKDELRKKTKLELQDTNISISAIDLAFNENDKLSIETNFLSSLNNDSSIGISDEKKVIKAKREIAKEMYFENNAKCYDNLFRINRSLSLEQEKEPKIIYISKYAPNIDLCLTKKQVYDIIKSEFVQDVYYYEDESLTIDDTYVQTNTKTENVNESFDTTWLEMTNTSIARDTMGYSGENITVGVYDSSFADPTFVNYFNNVDIDYSLAGTLEQSTYTHGNYMASIIAGRKIDTNTGNTVYEGVVPDAKIYCASGGYKPSIENLIDKGCNVINMSLLFSGGTSNTYGYISMWFDHIAYMHNVHFVCSAGNYGTEGIAQSNMIYNAIVVGNCYKNGLIKETSSYATGEYDAYKPDVIAPGANTNTPAINNPNVTFGGTSAASAIVCGAVAQLCQMSPDLLAKPMLLKSLLLSSSKRIYGDVTMAPLSDSNESSIALSREYGAGLIDVVKAYQTYIDYNRYSYNVFTRYSTSRSCSFNIAEASSSNPKLMRFALTWDKPTTIVCNEPTNGISSPLSDIFYLTVTTPSGEEYVSDCWFDTKQYISFIASESGNYTVSISRVGSTVSGEVSSYGLTCSVS